MDGSSLTQVSNQSIGYWSRYSYEKPTLSSTPTNNVASRKNTSSAVKNPAAFGSINNYNTAPAPMNNTTNVTPINTTTPNNVAPTINMDIISAHTDNVDILSSLDLNWDIDSLSTLDPEACQIVDDFIRATFNDPTFGKPTHTTDSPPAHFRGWDNITPNIDAILNHIPCFTSDCDAISCVSSITEPPTAPNTDSPLPPETRWDIRNHSVRKRFKSKPSPDCQGTIDSVTDSASSQPYNLSLEDEVQQLVTGTSQKFVPKPTIDEVLIDAMTALRRFKINVRSKEQRRLQHLAQTQDPQFSHSDSDSTTSTTTSIPIEDPPPDGLKTGLRPAYVCSDTTPGSPRLEAFLNELEKEVMNMAWNYRKDSKLNHISSQIQKLQRHLHHSPDEVVVPTDKTNSFRVIPLATYIAQVHIHLQAHGKKISHTDLTTISTEASSILNDLQPFLSTGEWGFLNQSIRSHAIPTPKLLIKDHKPKSPATGEYPTRLICPANNFISAFPKLGYLGLKKIFDDNAIDYKSNMITQASDLKAKLERLNIHPNTSTIISIDAQDYYPSVRFKLVQKAITYFTRHLPKQVRHDISKCMQLIRFGMKSTYLMFQDSYYEYDGDQNPDDRGLTIGGYESAWLSDIVGAYIFKRTSHLFNNTLFYGTYRDDGIAIFNNRMTYDEIVQWQDKFQAKVDELANVKLGLIQIVNHPNHPHWTPKWRFIVNQLSHTLTWNFTGMTTRTSISKST
jgi:hypothetical protein